MSAPTRALLLGTLGLLLTSAPAAAQMAPPPPGQIDSSQLSKLPKLKKSVEAAYPKEALDKRVEGKVVLLLDIGADGKVGSVGLAEPAEPPGMGFEESAMLAAQQLEFEPAEVNGKPIAVQINYSFRFKPPTEPTPPPAPPVPDPASTPAASAPAAPIAPARQPVVNYAGVLRERGTRLPLPGVLVTVFRDDGDQPLGFEATSDTSGAFQFLDLDAGNWKVLIEPPGYYPFRTTEEVRAGQKTQVTYFVEKGSYNPYDVTVTAVRPRKEVSRTVISAAEIDKIPGTAGDPLAVVQNFAGVARPPLLSGLLIIRGSAPEDSRYFADGAEIPLIYHFGGLRSVVPIGLIDSLEFYPGNFSPSYGRATGGLVDVQLKKLAPKRIGGYADVSILDTSLYLEVPLGDKAAFALGARRSYLDFLLNAVIPSDASVNLITAPRYFDYQALVNYRPAPAHDLRAFFIASDDQFAILFKDQGGLPTQVTSNTASTSSTFYRSILTYRYIPGDHFENMAQISQGRNKVNFKLGQLLFDINVYVSQIRDTVRYKAAPWATLVVGGDVQFSQTDLVVQLPRPPKEGEPPPMFDPSGTMDQRLTDRRLWSPGAFAEVELKPLPGLLILPGLRYDHFESVSDGALQPRLTARWQINPRVTVKGGAGLFVAEPGLDESDPKFGNPKLKLEHARHYSVGAEFKPRPYLTFDGTLFYKDLTNLVSFTDEQVTDASGTHPLVYDNKGHGRVYGLELIVRHDFAHNFTGWMAYTLSRSERRDSGRTDYRLFDFDQTHILSVIGSYQLPRNWTIGGRLRYVTGNPTTPVVGAVVNSSSDQYDPVYGRVNSARLGDFHQLDLRIDKRWIYPRWILGVYLDLQNVYNRSNPEAVTYNYNYRQSTPQQGLPILPILGIRGEL